MAWMSMVANLPVGAAAAAGCCAGAVCAADGLAANRPIARTAGIKTLMRSCPFALSLGVGAAPHRLLPCDCADPSLYGVLSAAAKLAPSTRPRSRRVRHTGALRATSAVRSRADQAAPPDQNVVPTAKRNVNAL